MSGLARALTALAVAVTPAVAAAQPKPPEAIQQSLNKLAGGVHGMANCKVYPAVEAMFPGMLEKAGFSRLGQESADTCKRIATEEMDALRKAVPALDKADKQQFVAYAQDRVKALKAVAATPVPAPKGKPDPDAVKDYYRKRGNKEAAPELVKRFEELIKLAR